MEVLSVEWVDLDDSWSPWCLFLGLWFCSCTSATECIIHVFNTFQDRKKLQLQKLQLQKSWGIPFSVSSMCFWLLASYVSKPSLLGCSTWLLSTRFGKGWTSLISCGSEVMQTEFTLEETFQIDAICSFLTRGTTCVASRFLGCVYTYWFFLQTSCF